jgi:hypothetical protein
MNFLSLNWVMHGCLTCQKAGGKKQKDNHPPSNFNDQKFTATLQHHYLPVSHQPEQKNKESELGD